MESKHKQILIGVSIIVVAIILFMYLKHKKDAEIVTVNDELKPTPKVLQETAKSQTFPLTMGSRGKEVKSLQSWLLKNEGSQIKVDGIWGKQTDAAVKKFLKTNNISKDKYTSMGLK